MLAARIVLAACLLPASSGCGTKQPRWLGLRARHILWMALASSAVGYCPWIFPLSGFAIALHGPSCPARVLLLLCCHHRPSSSLVRWYSPPISLFPSLQACAVLCCVLCRWAPVLAHLLSSAAACVRALLLIEFNSLSCHCLPLQLAVDW